MSCGKSFFNTVKCLLALKGTGIWTAVDTFKSLTMAKNISWEKKKVLTSDPARHTEDSASPKKIIVLVCIQGFTLVEFTSCFHKWEWWINHSDHKARPFGEFHNTESLSCELQIGIFFSDLRSERVIISSSWPSADTENCFLATTCSHLLSRSCKTLLPNDTGFSNLQLCSNQSHFEYVYGEYVTAYMRWWYYLPANWQVSNVRKKTLVGLCYTS